MNKFKLIKTTVSAVLISASLAGCGKTMDCNIASNHIHFYENEDTKIIKLIEGEREKRMGYNWTDNYVFMNNETKSICDNDLCYKIETNGEVSFIIVDNIEDVPSEYKYFKPNDFVVTCVSEPYYLKQPVK